MSNELKVGIIITNNQNDVLLIKERSRENTPLLWNIVKGSYGDEGKETIFEAAIRECKEEVGVEVVLTGLLGCYIARQTEKLRTQITFLAKIKKLSPRLASKKDGLLRNEHIEELKWCTKEDVKKMKPKEFISDRAYKILQDWARGNSFPLETVKQIKM